MAASRSGWVVGQPRAEQGERPVHLRLGVCGHRGAALAVEQLRPHVVHQGAVRADQGVRGGARRDLVPRGGGLLGEYRGHRACAVVGELPLASPQRGAGGDQAGNVRHTAQLGGLAVGEPAERAQQELAERGQQRLLGRAFAQGGDQGLLMRGHPVIDQVFLGPEVVEDGRLGDLGNPGDLGDGDPFEAVLEEQRECGVGDLPPSPPLLAFPQARLGAQGYASTVQAPLGSSRTATTGCGVSAQHRPTLAQLIGGVMSW